MAGGKTERFDLPASNNLACVLRVLQTERDFTVMVQSGRPPAEGVAAARPLPRQSVLLPGVERRSSVADLRARQAAGRGAANPAAGQGGQCALRASGLQSGRRTCDDRHAGAGFVETAHESHARRHGDRSRRTSCRGRFLDRGDGSCGGACGDVGQHLLDAAAHFRAAGGTIETPDWYFEGRDAARVAALDALLLTQGWRRYDVPAAVRGEYATPAYPLEVGQEIAGRINKGGLWNRKKKLDRYEMRMIVPRWHYSSQAPIDKEGRFALNGFDFPDSTLYVLRPAAAKGLLPEAYVKVARDSFPEVGTLPRVPETDAASPYLAQARHYIEQRGTDRYAQYPHRHGVCHASQTPRIHTARASVGGAYMDGRADQGIGSRNHPRLHRKNAGGTGSRNNGSIQTKECNLHVGRTYRTTSCRYSV